VEIHLHAFLTSALRGDEWLTSFPGRCTPRERARYIHWIEETGDRRQEDENVDHSPNLMCCLVLREYNFDWYENDDDDDDDEEEVPRYIYTYA
jgi:hypothetical protein